MFQNTRQSLFDRLPIGVFDVLSGPHAPRYMRVLERLYDDFFGPEADPGPDEGWPRRKITGAIQSYVADEPWPRVDGEDDRATPVEIHVEVIFNRLARAGWLVVTERDIRAFVTMPTNVHRLLGTLIEFAQIGPAYIGGTVQVIYNHLLKVLEEPREQAEGFHEAAAAARRMMDAISRTRGMAYEIMTELGKSESVADFAAMFFDEYLLKLFGVAYHKLHTIDHPLRHRHDILAIVTELREDPKKRSQILGWYEENAQHLGDANSAFERDVKMFMRFESIERHLERLTIAFNRVNAQGLNYIRYAVRTPGHIETAIADAICRVLQSAGPTRGMHLFSRLPFAESRLKLRSARVEGDDRPIVRKRVPTDEELALHRLNVAMREHRQVSTADKTAYIAKHLGDRARISSDDLPIESIKDFCVFIALARAAHVSERTRKTSDETPGYRIVRVEGEVTANRFLRLPWFVVEMKLLPTNGQERRR